MSEEPISIPRAGDLTLDDLAWLERVQATRAFS